jgi:alkylation response protein AidB-like acyl-CoA dehydrogenase
VFFDNVEVPADAVVGEVDKGWDASVVMLRNERVTIGTGARARSNPLGFDSLVELARKRGLETDTGIRRRLAQLYARETALRAYGRVLHEETTAGIQIGARGSAAKLAGAELALWAADLAQDIIGSDIALGRADLDRVVQAIVGAPGSATAGGTNEIQRNIVGERVLGLAKDPGVDRNTPFNQLKLSR